MTRSVLPLFDGFIETPFERRFQGLLRQAWHARRWHVIVAEPAPKNDPREAALGNFLLTALGLSARGRWSERKYLLFELLVQYGVECLIIDDAHDLSMPHL